MKRQSRPRGSAAPIIVILLVFAVLAALMAMVLRSGRDVVDTTPDLYEVKRGSFDVSIPAAGELEALNQIEVRNQLESRAVITFVAPEGTTVESGDVLIQLAEEDILNRIKDAEDALNTATAQLVAARAKLDIQRSARDSELSKAALDVELTELALRAWREGDLVKARQNLALELETAEIDCERLTDKYTESMNLLKEGFISKDQAEEDRIRSITAADRLKQAQLDIEVYEKYLYFQDEAKLESAVTQAQDEAKRVAQRHEAELETARVDVESKEHQAESRQERLDDLRRQHSYCTVVAPTGGLVVYATSIESSGHRRGGSDDRPPQVGTELRPNELVIVLPDTSQMVAAVKVNEALSGLIEPGQPSTIVSDALPETVLVGQVMSVGVLAETGGWRDPNRREYTVRILLETDPTLGLKPSMRCKSEIFVERVEDAVFAPVQSVFRIGSSAIAYVPDAGGYKALPVQVGRASELYVEIVDGLDVGDAVLLREPRAEELRGDAPQAGVRTAQGEGGEGRPDGGWARAGQSGGGYGGGRRSGGRPEGSGGGRPRGPESGGRGRPGGRPGGRQSG
ncbi:MAG: efflux RND transporter periplasmic adaptor subunit [Planctomycetota bacterium]